MMSNSLKICVVVAEYYEDIAKNLGIKNWTTIVVYKGDNEISRIIGQTDKEIIYSAIKKGI